VNQKAETVHYMAHSTPLDKIFGSLGGRILIAATQTVLISVGLLLIFLVRQYAEISLLKYLLAVGVGLIAGFSARRFLKGHTQILKLLAAALSAALSLAILNILSGGFLGMNPLNPFNGSPDWSGLIQFGSAVLMAWLAVQAFRSPSLIKTVAVSPPRVSRPAANRALPKPGPAPAKKTSPQGAEASSRKKGSLAVSKSKTRKKTPSLAVAKKKAAKKDTAANKLALAAAPKLKTKKAARPKRKRAKKISAKDIKFTGEEEHNCPYCLEPVEPHDPRGVKICPICKTHHHADCWGITGACQIPHSH
jgi:hypothetical protein